MTIKSHLAATSETFLIRNACNWNRKQLQNIAAIEKPRPHIAEKQWHHCFD